MKTEKFSFNDFSKKISLENFIDGEIDTSHIAEQEVETWLNRTFFSQMIDIWGEANRIVESIKAGCDIFLDQMKVFHDMCCIIYLNPNVTDGEKNELKICHWELFDFALWGNEWKNDVITIMKPFDIWMYGINYDLL